VKQGQFSTPRSVYNSIDEEMFYIGDDVSIQLYGKDDICYQRIGDQEKGNGMHQFHNVFDLCIMDNRLYVSDCENKRIQVFTRTSD